MNHSNKHSSAGRPARTEPALGDLGQLDPAFDDGRGSHRRHRASRGRRPVRRWPWLVLLVLVVLAGAWSQRQTLRSWLPQTQLNQLLDRADAALAEARLDGRQGDSARELYVAARTLEPGNERAEAGLRKTGHALLDLAKQQLDGGQLSAAATSLESARALLGGGDELDQQDARLAQLQASSDKLESLLERAAQALTDGNLDGDGGAAQLYKQALLADPGNAIATHGMDKLGEAMAARVRGLIADQQLDQARKQVKRLAQLLPDVSVLPQLQAELNKADRQAEAAQGQLLELAAADLAAGRLTGSGSDNALARFRKVLEADPGNATARAGVRDVAAGLLDRAGKRMDDNRLAEAGHLLDEVATLAGNGPQLAAARKRLAELESAPAPAPPLTAEEKAQVQRLITRARAAAEDGKLMLPPGENAWDMYRSALAIEPDNADAMAGLAALPGQARLLFDQALAQRDTARATQLLSVFAELAPGSSSLPDMRARLQAVRAGAGSAR